MSIFGSILNKIFHHAQAQPPAAGAQPHPAPAPAPAAPAQAAPAPAAPSAPAAPQPSVDVEAVLTQLAQAKDGGGNWRTSIVDLLKLLDLDSSLAARKELANELGVHVGADGSAEENIALHKAVMRKVADNGGTVPDSMKN